MAIRLLTPYRTGTSICESDQLLSTNFSLPSHPRLVGRFWNRLFLFRHRPDGHRFIGRACR